MVFTVEEIVLKPPLVPARAFVIFRDSIVSIAKEIQKRRTVAIISHPDAGSRSAAVLQTSRSML